MPDGTLWGNQMQPSSHQQPSLENVPFYFDSRHCYRNKNIYVHQIGNRKCTALHKKAVPRSNSTTFTTCALMGDNML